MRIISIFRSLLFAGLIFSIIKFTGCSNSVEANSGETIFNQSISKTTIDEFPVEDLSPEEADGLVFMREEEKLARDVYLKLFDKWGRRVFDNISRSEQNHMDAIKYLLEKYNQDDPVEQDSLGEFKNQILKDLYVSLTSRGESSLIEALKVGALIEEIDILDIQKELDSHVDNQDVTFVYQNLMKGSRNHLRAFVRNLSRQGIQYIPQKLSEEEYLTIINSDWERGRF